MYIAFGMRPATLGGMGALRHNPSDHKDTAMYLGSMALNAVLALRNVLSDLKNTIGACGTCSMSLSGLLTVVPCH